MNLKAAAYVIGSGLVSLPLLAQGPATGAIAGVVRDVDGLPLKAVRVFVEGAQLGAVSDDSGRFHLTLPSGKRTLAVSHFGYRAISFDVTVPADSTLVTSIKLEPFKLSGVLITGEKMSPRLARTGFYERLSQKFGEYLTPEEIERRSWAIRASALLRDVKGVEVRCQGTRCRVSSSFGAGGCIAVNVDGAYRRGQLDDVVSVSEVYAMEVYSRSTKVPAEFQGFSQGSSGGLTAAAGCGVIAVWTHSKAP